MARVCKFPDKDCDHSFYSESKSRRMCRLSEWKRKKAVCPYDKTIMSQSTRHKNQKELMKNAV